jgi:ribonuclease HI
MGKKMAKNRKKKEDWFKKETPISENYDEKQLLAVSDLIVSLCETIAVEGDEETKPIDIIRALADGVIDDDYANELIKLLPDYEEEFSPSKELFSSYGVVALYTDGACVGNPGKGGWGVYIQADKRAIQPGLVSSICSAREDFRDMLKDCRDAFEIKDHQKEMFLFGGCRHTTNNRMELKAVIEGLKSLNPGQKVVVFTDSRYVIDSASKWIFGWKRKGWRTAAGKLVKNIDLLKKLDKLVNKHEVEWVWVKGHSGDAGNEMADFLANKGIESLKR